jgi:hypothetical protein
MVLEPEAFGREADPAGPSHPIVQVAQVEAVGNGRLVVIARCLAATRLGARFRLATPNGDSIDLTLIEIRRYRRITVTELDASHAARFVFTSTGSDDLRIDVGDILHGSQEPSA